ncbi:MAG: hypothetical protein KDE14_07930 [Rhodobacteraceae bacterium]|nr:hypothetical protein [Paracoccaceae bacterium]
MRPLITALDVDALAWKSLGPAGLYSKLLSRDPDTGARTALQRLDPGEGFEPPKVAHFHHTYEELLGVKGRFTFDCKRWITPTSYLFHPPKTVHGFKSTVPEESWFLSRVGRDLDVNLVPEPTGTDIYPIDGVVPQRPAAAFADPIAEKGLKNYACGKERQAFGICEVSVDPKTGEGTAFVRLPANWIASLDTPLTQSYLEVFVLDGDVTIDDEFYGCRYYGFYPAGRAPTSFRSQSGATIYVNFGAPLAVEPVAN